MYKNLTFCAALPCRLRLVEHWLLPVMEREKMLPVLFLSPTLLVFVRFNKSSPIFTQCCYYCTIIKAGYNTEQAMQPCHVLISLLSLTKEKRNYGSFLPSCVLVEKLQSIKEFDWSDSVATTPSNLPFITIAPQIFYLYQMCCIHLLYVSTQ